ncbi:hypothetical protein T492DRAFT_1033855 [Pavlovales sp. CCMP2436]|nr:hypothetical protein T492DRAFT_1033855 [Pavlovales sp. CCMP2436]|mmetsp:Transcript_692/g.1921  ORF Transcript_692/g.1921 Transcript_692/m.1921 type:complete len:225 (-) Transcript_692:201-875(-)
MPRPSPSARNATSSTWRRTGGTRSSARSCSILGLASLRLDDFLCSRLLGPAPDGGIQFAMTFDKRHRRGMFDADARTHRRMERRVDARAPARRACRGLPIPQLQVQAQRWQQAIPEQQARLRSGQPDHRPRAHHSGPTPPATSVISLEEEINALGLRWHGPRHLLIQIAELIRVAKGCHDFLGRWAKHHRQRATRGSPAGPARHEPKCSAPRLTPPRWPRSTQH